MSEIIKVEPLTSIIPESPIFDSLKNKIDLIGAEVKSFQSKRFELSIRIAENENQIRSLSSTREKKDDSEIGRLKQEILDFKKEIKDILGKNKALVLEGQKIINEEFPKYLHFVNDFVNKNFLPDNDPFASAKRKEILYKAKTRKFILLEILTNYELSFSQRLNRKLSSFLYRVTSYGYRKKYVQDVAKNHPIYSDADKNALLFDLYEKEKKFQDEIQSLRLDGEDKVVSLNSEIKKIKKNRDLDNTVKSKIILNDYDQINLAKTVRKQNSGKIKTLGLEGEILINENYNYSYYHYLKINRKHEIAAENIRYKQELKEVSEQNKKDIAEAKALPDDNPQLKKAKEGKVRNVTLTAKNKLYDTKFTHKKNLTKFKDNVHSAFVYKYHMIDILRNSRFTMAQRLSQRAENSVYSFKLSNFFLKYGLYIAILLIFFVLAILSPSLRGASMLEVGNILEIFSQATPRLFLAFGVAGLIILGGTDLSVGRMTATAGIITAMIFHNGNNDIRLFGSSEGLNFDAWNPFARIISALLIAIIFCVLFSSIAGFFSAKFKMHPFISTLSTQLIIYGFISFATNGAPSGGINENIFNMVAPNIGDAGSTRFPTIILWGIALIVLMWVLWNKTIFGKNMYAVGGNKEAASVSGINVFLVTMGLFLFAGVLYGFGGFLEAVRMKGTMSSNYASGWEGDAIAADVVGGVSFAGGIGKVSGVVIGVLVFQALQYALTFLNIDTNLVFIFKGAIIIFAVTVDSLKYMKRK